MTPPSASAKAGKGAKVYVGEQLKKHLEAIAREQKGSQRAETSPKHSRLELGNATLGLSQCLTGKGRRVWFSLPGLPSQAIMCSV